MLRRRRPAGNRDPDPARGARPDGGAGPSRTATGEGATAAGDDPADAAALAGYAAALGDAVDAAIAGWVERSVARVLDAEGLIAPDAPAAAAAAGAEARREGAARVRALLATDIDDQHGNPLAVLRTLVRYPTAVLRAAGARPVDRDDFAVRAFPDDLYDLSPATFADIDPALHEPALLWGAAKAHVHLARRRREGRR